jgi:hypothetical protein
MGFGHRKFDFQGRNRPPALIRHRALSRTTLEVIDGSICPHFLEHQQRAQNATSTLEQSD